MRIWELAALLALSISLCAGAWAEARQSSISSRLIRLHVIAASDETQEQEIKLRVRDAVLEYLAPRLDGATDAVSLSRPIPTASQRPPNPPPRGGRSASRLAERDIRRGAMTASRSPRGNMSPCA